MFEKIKRNIAHYIVARKYIKKNLDPIRYNKAISNAIDFLIVMPKQDQDFLHSFDLIKYLLIHRKNMTLFLPEHRYNLIPEKEKYKFISYYSGQISRFNLPDKSLKERLRRKTFDIVIDLNRNEDIFFSAIVNLVQSTVRIGFNKERSENYYNLQFVDTQSEPELSYRNLLSYMQMF